MNAAMPRKKVFVATANEERPGFELTMVYATALEYIHLKLCVNRENRGSMRVHPRSEETDEEERGAQVRDVKASCASHAYPITDSAGTPLWVWCILSASMR